MLCLPVFIILLLLASPAASNPLETRIQSDLIRAALEDADMKNEKNILSSIMGSLGTIGNVVGNVCCSITKSCCASEE
uniref:Conotoxin Ar5.1 a n=1 Tax=Conus arenatus TaxID=89451 RepID=CT51_CONAE|nr:RecName: Full=Conotoxin Ar5.1 a; AltName: Full=Conotoxin ArMLCL-D02171; AltName: Full=Conotoxin ArMLCL-D02172; Flags: Precursor [Conus arenatus]AAG60417.1 conotoxin scaffold IX precursor [Conus arenatus]AAG60521.1 conotoxin scaffold IX precursor [Conus arenatus]